MSNLEWFKYEWIWEKTKAGNFIQAKNNPLKLHENVLVFSGGVVIHKGQSVKRMLYNPIGVKDVNKAWHRPQVYDSEHHYKRPSHSTDREITQECFPGSIIKIGSVHNPPHPTQKPVALFEYLIRTYTNEGDTVLDNCAGSGTTGVACINTNRKYILIEKDASYCEIIRKRIENHEPL
jgi:site-specific DNA-methyltransferase (adenine-specific)